MKLIKINLPKDKEAHNITATPHDGYIEVNYELKDKWTPKDGDYVKYIGNGVCYLLIYKQQIESKTEGYVVLNTSSGKLYIDGSLHYFYPIITPATEEEKQQLLNAMHKEGKGWDFVKKKIVEYWWKPNVGDHYYSVTGYTGIFKYEWGNDGTDNKLYNCHNCFRTKEEARIMRDRLLKVLNGAKFKGE